MNKKLLSGLMSVVMLAGSGATVGAHEVGKSKVSNNSVVRFVKNHKKIIVGMLVVGAGAGVGYYKREEVKNGFNTAKDKIKEMKLTPLKEVFNKFKGKFNNCIKSKLAENTKLVELPKDTESKANEKSVKDAPASEPESGEDATGSTTVPTTETESVKSATESKT